MNRKQIEQITDAYIEGFKHCRNMVLDLIDDEIEISQEKKEASQEIVKAEPKPEKPKKANAQKIDRGKVCALLDAGWKVPKIAGEMNTSEASIYNIQKEYREQKAKQEGQAQA